MTATEHVILVDEEDNPIGTAEKMAAHREGRCHRAFSVFILEKSNPKRVLLQQRAKHKYHSPLLWTNTCCSHPRPHEDIISAGERRLREELGLSIKLNSLGFFHYIAHFDNGLTENEVDHVLIGYYQDQPIVINPSEVEAYCWVALPDLEADLAESPEKYTPWLREALTLVSLQLDE